MKVCTILESEIYLNGICKYIRSVEKNKRGIHSVLLKDLENKYNEVRILSGLKKYDIIILDFSSYEKIIRFYKNDYHKTRNFRAKIIFLKFGPNYPIFTIQNQGRSWKFKTVTLPIDHVIQPSITENSFRRLLFSISTEKLRNNLLKKVDDY